MYSQQPQAGIDTQFTEYAMMSTSKRDPGERELEEHKEGFLLFAENNYGTDVANILRASMQDSLDEPVCWHRK